ncbi:MAG TPA: right-handed parallel beta-helix repeat-containing protein [Thermoanaerobaculia bacterium]|nr:right-handed parallel beta-helix repeat-containing protein [Thermoanaerobaculia bacterium]
MTVRSLKLTAVFGLAILCSWSPRASAQAYRTFISGVGNDANPCTRALPCQSFSVALAQTHQAGEIYVVDALDQEAVGTGPITIYKSVSIIGAGSRAAISGEFLIAPEAGGQVLLKGLDFTLGGVQVTTGVGISLVIDDCTFVNSNILFQPAGTATSNLVVRNSTVSGNPVSPGILIQPQSTGRAVAVIEGVNVSNNYFGIHALDYSTVTVRNSVVTESVWFGIRSEAQASPPGLVTVFVEHTQVSHNGGNGVLAAGSTATMRLSDVTITDNGAGIATANGGIVYSFGNNCVSGNPTTTPPAPLPFT